VRVEPDEASAANLFLKGQSDVIGLISELGRMIAPAESARPSVPRRGAEA
jgi:hypothetical protein